MNLHSGSLSGLQKIDIFSKRKPIRIRVRLPFLAVILFCIVVGVASVWERVQYIRLGSEIEMQKQENARLLQEKRKLLLEFNTMISLDQVEKRARSQLGMRLPEAGQVLYVK